MEEKLGRVSLRNSDIQKCPCIIGNITHKSMAGHVLSEAPGGC